MSEISPDIQHQRGLNAGAVAPMVHQRQERRPRRKTRITNAAVWTREFQKHVERLEHLWSV